MHKDIHTSMQATDSSLTPPRSRLNPFARNLAWKNVSFWHRCSMGSLRASRSITSGKVKQMDTSLEQVTMRKVAWRLVPFLCMLYIIAFIIRINVGFASLTMGEDLGLTRRCLAGAPACSSFLISSSKFPAI